MALLKFATDVIAVASGNLKHDGQSDSNPSGVVMARCATVLIVMAAALLGSACSTPRFVIEAENARTNTHIVLAFEETVFNKHHVHEGFNRYVAADYKEHDPTLAEDLDAAARKLNNELTNDLPDSHVVVKRTMAQRDLVAVHAFWDQKPGVTRGVARVDIYRLVNSKIVEHWVVQQPIPEGGGTVL
jgi:predicted SnoaL-like aldol condensation-catalyzing enzyme